MAVEDGVAFCPNCAAPQIRVSGLASRPAPLSFSPESIGEGGSANAPAAPPATRLRWPEALRSAALGGMLLALALVGQFAWPFLLMLAAGGLTAVLYARRLQTQLTRGLGARIGAAGALLGWTLLLLLFLLQLRLGGGHILSILREAIQQQVANNPDPRAQQLLATLNTPAGVAVVVSLLMFLFLLAALLCGAVGGALGASLLRRPQDKDRRGN